VTGYGSTNGIRQRFTGQEWDSETGLYYFNARYYSPEQGRFTGVDPGNAGAVMGDPQSWNGYAYVTNNPLSYTDPSGEGLFGTIFNVGIFIANTALKASTFGSIQLPGTSPNLGGLMAERLGRGANDGAWNEQPPAGGGFEGLNTGGVFGSGSAGDFVFSLAAATRRSMACSADATLNFAAGFIPGYNLLKAGVGFFGFNIHPFEAIETRSTAPLSVGASAVQYSAGAGSLNEVIHLERFRASGGRAALDRLKEVTGRASFGLRSAESQAKDLARLAQLSKLAKGVSVAGTVANLLNTANFAYDVYRCW
jgi:RHS repeat-associated protein